MDVLTGKSDIHPVGIIEAVKKVTPSPQKQLLHEKDTSNNCIIKQNCSEKERYRPKLRRKTINLSILGTLCILSFLVFLERK